MEKRLEDVERAILNLSKSIEQLSYALGAKAAVHDIAIQLLLQQQRPNPEFCARLRQEIDSFLGTRNYGFDSKIDSAVSSAMNVLLEAAGEPPNTSSSSSDKPRKGS